MNYPAYFRQNGKYTAVFDAIHFVEVQMLHTVSRITIGTNSHMVDYAIDNDKPIDEKEFMEAFELCNTETSKMIEKLEKGKE